MSSRQWSFLASSLLAISIGAGCQTYDFEPVDSLTVEVDNQGKDVVAKSAKPNLMLLVDKSGSMDLPVDPANAACPSGCGATKATLCPSTCPTRWTQLQAAMDSFLRTNGSVARLGMMAFPADSSCGAPGSVEIELAASSDRAADLQFQADRINAALQQISSSGAAGSSSGTGGGTPISPSLRLLESYAGLQDPSREDLVLLLTDGLPNCNESNVNSCAAPVACRCTLSSGSCGSPGSAYCTLGCLDEDGSVAAVTALRAREIKTIVVGFGADTAQGDGPQVLSALAQAGGFRPACASDADCGSIAGSCEPSSNTCLPRFYQAANGAELAAALAAIARAIDPKPCEYELTDPPVDARMISIRVDGEPIPSDSGTWSYVDGKLTFTGELCAKLEASTPASPVRLQVQVLERL